jgi:sulfopropanediol 3-dehydrogenase
MAMSSTKARYIKTALPSKEQSLGSVSSLVEEILRRIRSEGEMAVREYSERFDNWNPVSFRVPQEEIQSAENNVSDSFKENVKFLHEQLGKFALAQKAGLKDFELETLQGVHLGQKFIPLRSVGVYVPGGRYRLIASAQMSIVPAKVAGVRRIVACAPAKGGPIDQHLLYSIASAGADEIYALGGAQAIGTLAFGAGIMEPVDMIAGPGNVFVAEAKRQLYGAVGIDFIAGPTEILIIADEAADPQIVAADLVGQSEHDPNAKAILVTTSEEFARKTLSEVERQFEGLETVDVAKVSWEARGEIIVVPDFETAAQLADEYAPEHLEVQTKNWQWFRENLHNYGSLFLGEEATVTYSDKAIGTNHILPTGRGAKYTGGLWVGKYLKNVTYQWLSKDGSLRIAPVAAAIAREEGMFAHTRTADLRIRKYLRP